MKTVLIMPAMSFAKAKDHFLNVSLFLWLRANEQQALNGFGLCLSKDPLLFERFLSFIRAFDVRP